MNRTPQHSTYVTSFLLAVFTALFAFAGSVLAQQVGTSPVKIFILAGQSNMVGQGNMSPVTTQGTLEYIVANDPGNDYQFLKSGSSWVVRDDVWITDENGKRGGLTVGYGSGATTVGPELGFGHTVGGQYENQVLIVKCAWGGKSLAVDFRPPGSGGVTGFYYTETLRLVNDAIANLGTYFPGYNGQGYEIAGFVWHQGWNDRVTPAYSAEYQVNMANFIRDIRTDLEVPGLPFVIATSAMDGNGPGAYSEVEKAQRAMVNPFLTNPAPTDLYEDFVGSVAVVDTRITYDGMEFWQPVEYSPADQGYHWNRNAKTYVNIGLATGDAMSTLSPGRCPSRLRAVGDTGGIRLAWQNGLDTPASVRILRDGAEIAAAAPVTPAGFLDTTALPGLHNYELAFTMPGDPCDPLTVTFDGNIAKLEAFRSPSGVGLTWQNTMTTYAGIELRRDGVLIEAGLPGNSTSYTDTSPPASGLVTYSVVPTTGTATQTVTQINLAGPPSGNALIYEPFDYAVGGLNLQSSDSEVGLEGSWNADSTTLVTAGTLSYGALPVGGAKLSNFTASQNRFGGSRAIRASALAANGLLADGATLWFSVIMGYDGGNATNTTLAFALASNQFTAGNYSYQINETGGTGLGVFMGRFSGANYKASAAEFRDTSFGTGFSGIVYGNPSAGTPFQNAPRLVVGKFTWGATQDTLELYLPDTDLNLGSVESTLTVNVDQSTFDTITAERGDKVVMDEIRFGASYEAVIGAGGGDTTPPEWASNWPQVDSVSATGFTARARTDEDGTAYYVVLADGAAAPSAAQVKAGNDSSGLPALKSGSIALAANTENTSAVSGLSPGTACDVWFVAEDGLPNLQANPVKVDVTTETLYATWSGGAAFAADANGDGVQNGLAWLLGAANKDADATGLLPAASESGDSLVLTFSCLNAANRGSEVLSVQHSGDLGISDAWAASAVPEASGTVSGVLFVVTPNGKLNAVVATIPSNAAAVGKLFGRLQASQP